MTEGIENLALALAKGGLTAEELIALTMAKPYGSNPIRTGDLEISRECFDRLIQDGFAYETSAQHSGKTIALTLTGAGRIVANALTGRTAA